MHLAAFALTMAAGQLTPGPDMLLILKNTLNHGLPAGLATIGGICLGIILHVLLVFTGLAALLAASPSLFRGIQIVGAGYLLWIAWKLLRSLRGNSGSLAFTPRTNDAASHTPTTTLAQAFREGFVTNLTNVKVMILFSSILAPLAMTVDGLDWRFGAVIIIEAALIWPAFAWLMQRRLIREAFFRYQRAFNLIFGLLLTAFAVQLVLPK